MTGQGFHFALTRDESKQLFGQKTDDALRGFITTELKVELSGTGRIAETDKSWNAIHRCLSDGTLDPAAGELPLNHCVLGGRHLQKGTDMIAAFVRPDIVPHAATAMQNVTGEWLRQRYDAINEDDYGATGDEDFQSTWEAFQRLAAFFQRAAEDGNAVLFTVDK